MAGGLVTVAGEHHIEHARTDRNRCGIARIEVIVVFRVGCRGIQLLNMRPGHALTAGNAVLQVDVVFVRFHHHGIHLTGVAFGNRREQAVFKLIAAGLQIGRFRQKCECQLHIGVERVITLLFFDAVNNHGDQPPSLSLFHYKAM